MSDGRIKIAIEVDGKEVNLASKELDNLEDAGLRTGKGIKAAEGAVDGLADSSAKASSDVKGVSDSLDNVSNDSRKASTRIKEFATAIGLVALAAAAFKTLKASMDDAISRFDTLNNFPKVLQALGVSAEESERAIERLSEGIDGLPTKLDDIASTAQRMYTSFGDMDKATESALALNNALLASGANSAEAQRGTEQYLKALQTGKMDMNMWTTLQETMNVGLTKVAEAFGMTEQELYRALQSGGVSIAAFNDKLVELGTGTGELADIAKVNSLGIATSLANLRTSAARGIADMLASFDKLSKKVTGKDIAENIDSLKVIINQSFKVIGRVIESTTPIVIGFANAIGAVLPVVNALSPALIGLGTAYAIHKVISLTTAAIAANTTASTIATASKNVYAIATNRLALAMALAAVQLKIQSAALLAYNKIVALATTVQAMLTSGMSLASIATIVLSGAIHILNVAIKVLLGPIGWVTLAIGALVGATVGIVKWFKRSSEEAKRLNAETEELGESTNSLNDSIENSSQAYKENQRDIKTTAQANSELAKKVEELASKENKSVAEKALLQSHIESLNGSIEGLNLAYDEEANALNMSSKELQARMDLMKETEAGMAAQERLTEIMKEQSEVQMQLEEINEFRAEWNRKLEEGATKSGEYKDAVAKLDEQEQLLKETLAQLAEQYGLTEEQMVTAAQNAANAIEEGNLKQITSYEQLEGALKETFDNMKTSYDELVDKATNAFDRMNEESKVTAEEMIANLEHNQKMTEQWGENVAKLYDWAGKEGHDGFLNWLETMGPESAAELAVVADMSDNELKRFAELMDKGAQVAGDSFKTSLGNEFDEAVDVMVNSIDVGSKSMRDQIKNSGFDEIGSMIPEGLSGGIEKGTPQAEKASKSMADDTTKATKQALGINSPSRVFREIGTNLTESLALGISNGTSKVTQAIQKMFRSVQTDSTRSFRDITRNYDRSVSDIEKSLDKLPIITQIAMLNMLNRLRSGANTQILLMRSFSVNLRNPFNNLNSQFNSIGRNAMSGLNAGLNAGRAQVMNTARSIANNVASTMKNALKIHSPSRLMRDDVGKWIPFGIAQGIKENAKTVYDELKNLSNNMIMKSTPEQALGTARMQYTGVGSQFIDTFKNKITRSISSIGSSQPTANKQPANITLVLGGREFEVFVDDITTVQDRKSYRLKAFRG